MNPDGTNQVQLTNNPTANDTAPSISGDGQHIVFNSDRDGNIQIYSMNIDGANQTNLTTNPATDSHASWGIPQATTTTTLTATPSSPAAANTTETLTATVTPASAVGNVQFNDGSTPWAACPFRRRALLSMYRATAEAGSHGGVT
ncbi:MAG: TolB family protein [Pseudonocardiaceae bacterium]